MLNINNNKKFISVSEKITKYSGKPDERAEEFKRQLQAVATFGGKQQMDEN